jgi:hypothetical protein
VNDADEARSGAADTRAPCVNTSAPLNIGTWLNGIHCCEPTGQTAWLGPIFPAVIPWTMVCIGKGPEDAPDGSLTYQSFMFTP